ncbi:hypothetical protein D3C72_1196340 [compost metagenome]
MGVGIVLGKAGPEPFGDELRPALAGDAPDGPGDGLRRSVLVIPGAALASIAGRMDRLQEVIDVVRRVRLARHHADRAKQAEVRGQRFRVADLHFHVEVLLHRGLAERVARQFGHILRQPGLWIELAFLHQHRRQQARHRLGHRRPDMRLVRPEAAEVALVHDAALVQHDKAVGVGIAQVVGQPHGIARHAEGGAVQPVARVPGQRHGVRGMPDAGCGRHLARVAQRPAHERRAQAVAAADLLVGRRREALHDAVAGRATLRHTLRHTLRQQAARRQRQHHRRHPCPTQPESRLAPCRMRPHAVSCLVGASVRTVRRRCLRRYGPA